MEAHGVVVDLDSLPIQHEGLMSIGPVANGICIIRLEEDGFVVALDGCLELLQRTQSTAAVMVGFRKIRLEEDGLVVALHSRLILLKNIQSIATAKEGLCIVWICLNRAVEQTQRFGVMFRLKRTAPQKMKRAGMERRVFQNLPAEGFR